VTACSLPSSRSMSSVLLMVRGRRGYDYTYFVDYCNYFNFDVDMGQCSACLSMF
jgi:hypothetical protein